MKQMIIDKNNAILYCWDTYLKNGNEGIDFSKLDDFVNTYCNYIQQEKWNSTTYLVKCYTLCNITYESIEENIMKHNIDALHLRQYLQQVVRSKY